MVFVRGGQALINIMIDYIIFLNTGIIFYSLVLMLAWFKFLVNIFANKEYMTPQIKKCQKLKSPECRPLQKSIYKKN